LLKLFKPIEQRPVRRSITSFSEISPSAKIADQFLLSLLLLVLAAKYFQVMARSSRRGRVTRSLTPHPASRWYAVTELGVASPELPGAGSVPDRGENPCEVLTDA